MRIARTQIVAATLLLAGCANLRPQPGGYEDILAIGATYPAGSCRSHGSTSCSVVTPMRR